MSLNGSSKEKLEYRKQMKCGYTRLFYNQRNKYATIIRSVIKRLFGEYWVKASKNTEQGTIILMYRL